MKHAACQLLPLADGEVGHVSLCPDCGQVHLSLQYMTLRFDLPAFRALLAVVEQAQHRLDHLLPPAGEAAAATAAASAGGLH
ncbi:hypothetical protein [Eleftheria terrae]|uniref:hypothetical protein n=1 Tax=Eleftheria terrae TaxID=1597781 RepID=UPI00263BA7A5|nr:hypothetical protein [Eleftheria terrae]WKB51674.1 hypothetical protein N7L95_17990 [Eleftheria terrae]